jgi:hypothetical protein
MNLIYGADFRKEIFVANMQQIIIYGENLARCQNPVDLN